MIQHLKLGFIGAGNMTTTLVRGLVESGRISPKKIFVSNRTERKLTKMADSLGIVACAENERVVEAADVIVIAVKPQDLVAVVEPLRSMFHPSQAVLSLAAGIPLATLEKLVPGCRVGRLMPNTPTSIRRGVLGFATNNSDGSLVALVTDIFDSLGLVVPLPENDAFEALTVSCASGPGFIFELMQIWQEWIEQFDIDSETARQMVLQTFWGTAELARKDDHLSFYELQTKVVSKKGVTAAGLESLREREIDSVLRYSFQRAVMRSKELSKIDK